jgi:hypothetical protein
MVSRLDAWKLDVRRLAVDEWERTDAVFTEELGGTQPDPTKLTNRRNAFQAEVNQHLAWLTKHGLSLCARDWQPLE